MSCPKLVMHKSGYAILCSNNASTNRTYTACKSCGFWTLSQRKLSIQPKVCSTLTRFLFYRLDDPHFRFAPHRTRCPPSRTVRSLLPPTVRAQPPHGPPSASVPSFFAQERCSTAGSATAVHSSPRVLSRSTTRGIIVKKS